MGSYPTVSPLPARMRAVSFLWRFPSGFPARALPGIGDGGGFTASFRAHEEIILTAQSHRPDCAFGGVIVQLQEAVIQIGPRLGQTGQRISDGLGQWRLAGEFTQLRPKPYLQIIKDRLGVFLLEAVLEKLGLIDHENNEIVKQKGIYKLASSQSFIQVRFLRIFKNPPLNEHALGNIPEGSFRYKRAGPKAQSLATTPSQRPAPDVGEVQSAFPGGRSGAGRATP